MERMKIMWVQSDSGKAVASVDSQQIKGVEQ